MKFRHTNINQNAEKLYKKYQKNVFELVMRVLVVNGVLIIGQRLYKTKLISN